jgi:AAA+ superfamily predicted ATPase
MSAATWLDDNNHYLAVSLIWLRARLRSALSGGAVTDTTGSRTADADATDRETASRTDPPPALLLLAQNFGLSDFERDVLLLCAAVELAPDMASLLTEVPGTGARGYPTFALAMQALPEPGWDALSPHRPLRYMRLLEINQPGATPLTAAALRADERVVNYIKGLNALDERLSALVVPGAPEARGLAPSQLAVAETIVTSLEMSATDRLPTIELLGAEHASKGDVANHVCLALKRRIYRMSIGALPSQKAELDTLVRLWQRETMMLPVALYIDAEDMDSGNRETETALKWFLSRDLGLVFVGRRESAQRTSEACIAFEVSKPTVKEQRAAWHDALRTASPLDQEVGDERVLAGQFNLNLHDIHETARIATHSHEPGTVLSKVWALCRDLTRPRLDQLAQRIEPKATWDDLVLPVEALSLLRQIAAHVRGRYQVFEDWGYARKMTRGFGISALFAGESGTGKTMAAEVLADELRLSLYRIDLSAVVSKYIGETEKNLRKLFDAAEQGGSILFFDEADALFGKRSEVKDSHDRYANIEINYLLQRMESFSGLAILATNMKSALDQAFMRRLRFIVNFPFPSSAERIQIWRKALAPDVPREALDYERLARFNLSGGNIHSIALNATFAAAQRGERAMTVTMQLLLSAIRTELRKLDKQVNDADFLFAQPVKGAA